METVLNSAGDQIQRMQSVLRDFKLLLDELTDQRQRTAERYNVFEALVLDEPAHSRFIANLLDPRKHHDQGDIFLISFLKCLGLNFCRSSTQDAEVSPEFNLDPHSRIDIHIRLANGQIILIENKIGAPEDTDQIAKYQDWLQCQDSSPNSPHHLVFLTPEGRGPSSARRPEDVICLSYSHLSDWIESSSQFSPERLRLVLEQYAKICRQVGGSTNKGTCMTDEIRQLFLDADEPERLETALQIEARLPDVKKCLFQIFWGQVGKELTERLKASGHDRCWRIRFDDDIFRNWAGFEIAWQNSQNKSHFAVRVESWVRGKMLFGVTRNTEVNDNCLAKEDKSLKARLAKQGFKRNFTSELGVIDCKKGAY